MHTMSASAGRDGASEDEGQKGVRSGFVSPSRATGGGASAGFAGSASGQGRAPLGVKRGARSKSVPPTRRRDAIWKTAGQYDRATTIVTFDDPIEAQVHRESAGAPMGPQLGFIGTHAVCLGCSSPMTTTGECDNLDCNQRICQQVQTQSRDYGPGSHFRLAHLVGPWSHASSATIATQARPLRLQHGFRQHTQGLSKAL
jgi:hypothetical protein